MSFSPISLASMAFIAPCMILISAELSYAGRTHENELYFSACSLLLIVDDQMIRL